MDIKAKQAGLLFIMLIMSIIDSAAQINLPGPQVVKINERVYALLGPAELPDHNNRGYMVNSTVIIGDRGVILIDTGFSDEIGRHLKHIVAGISDKPVTYIINTHDHGDHVLGNSEFSDATIISSEKCKAIMEASGYEWIGLLENMTGVQFPHSRPVTANIAYAEGTRTSITLLGVNLTIWVPQGSHTDNDLMVYLPDDSILVAGDVVVNTMMPSFRDANVRNWLSTLQQIAETPVSVIVPGHGVLMTREEVATLHHAMSELYAAVEAGYNQGLTDSEIRQTLELGEWKKLKYFEQLMGANINRTYLEVEAENF